ncbi:MAG: HpcH/HpaI aldolase family protein [Alphaproteobacteria bacterium]
MPSLKSKLADPNKQISMHICTIPSATVTQAMAAAGADAVVIDLEHGAVDYGSAHAMIAATAGSDCAPLVRVAKNDAAHVKRVLDLGAEGIVFPLIKTAEDARRAVASLRYPPVGDRGFGPFIAHSHWKTGLLDFAAEMDGEMVCCLLIETVEAVENIVEICAVEGIDLIIPAQFDLSTALGVSGQFGHPDFIKALEKIENAANATGIPLGGVAMSKEQADALFAKGYRQIAGFDLLMLKASVAAIASWTK